MSHSNSEKIIDQFDMYIRRGIYDDWKLNDKFLKFILKHSNTPSFQGRKETKICPYTGKQSTDYVTVKRDNLSPEQLKELREVSALMDGYQSELDRGTDWYSRREYEKREKSYEHGRYAEHAKWTTSDELRERIRKVPPDMQNSILVIAIAIYLLRVLGAEFNADTATFGTFFDNWHQLIIGSYDLA